MSSPHNKSTGKPAQQSKPLGGEARDAVRRRLLKMIVHNETQRKSPAR